MRTRTIILSSTGLLAAAAIGYGAAVVLDDPDASVEAIPVGGFTTPTTTTAGTTAPGGTAPGTTVPVASPVEGLEQLVGELRAGDDPDDWQVAGVDVDFGPDGWLATAPAVGDFDGDGTTEPVQDELSGLEGREVTLGVRYEDDDEDEAGDRGDADVYTIDGETFRDPTGGPPPWQSTGDQPTADREAIAAAAVAAVGDGARAGEVERDNDDGWDGWEVEVRGRDGREYQVLLDAGGTVVDVRVDD